MEYIKRAIEDVALQTDRSFKCLLITGARQTGKTEMIRKLFPEKKYVSKVVKRGQWENLTSPRHAEVCSSCCSPTQSRVVMPRCGRVKRLSRELNCSWRKN